MYPHPPGQVVLWSSYAGRKGTTKLHARPQNYMPTPAPPQDAAVTVILISLKAGGVALNLTVASHIYLMDPWWNPAAEYQAIDRAHRLGQQKPIRAVRFVVRNTVEERILRLQDKKRLVFEGTVGGDAASLGQLTEEDLRFLFG